MPTESKPTLSIKVGVFDPAKVDWNDYLTKFQLVQSHYEWSAKECFTQLATRLGGAAFHLYADEKPATFEELVDLLETKYAVTTRKQEYHAEYLERVLAPDESITRYVEDLERLGRRAFPGTSRSSLEPHLMIKFLSGVQEPELREWLNLQQFDSLKGMQLAASRWRTYKPGDPGEKPLRDRAHLPPRPTNRNKAARAAAMRHSSSDLPDPPDYNDVLAQMEDTGRQTTTQLMTILDKRMDQLVKAAQDNRAGKPGQASAPNRLPPTCWCCNKTGHIYPTCPKNPGRTFRPSAAQREWMRRVRENRGRGVGVGPPPPAQPEMLDCPPTPPAQQKQMTHRRSSRAPRPKPRVRNRPEQPESGQGEGDETSRTSPEPVDPALNL